MLDAQTGKPIFVRLLGKGSGSTYYVNAIREDSNGNVIVRGTQRTASVWQEFVAKFDGATAEIAEVAPPPILANLAEEDAAILATC